MREVDRAEHASTEQLSALLDGRAEPDEQGFLAGHVERCVVCSSELADLRSVRDLLRALPVYLPPRSFTIPVEPARPTRRFGRLVPLTRALGTIAAVLCVVLFSVDAMQTGYDAPAPMSSVPDGAGAMHLTTRATLEAAAAAEPQAAARAAPESEKPADAAPKIANAPAGPPAPAAKPAAALVPAATQAPFSTPRQSIANAVTATPAGIIPRPAAESAARPADTSATGRAESVAAAPPAPQPAATATPARPAGAPAQSVAAPPQPAAAAPPQPAAAQQEPGAAAKPQAQSAQTAPQPTSAAFAPPPPAPTVLPAPVQRPPVTSPWLSPIRLWSLGFALVAAALLIASLVLSRISRTGPRDEWTRS